MSKRRMFKPAVIIPQDLKELRAVRSYLNSVMVDREREIDALCLTLLADSSCLLLGDPGTGKTRLIDKFAACVGLSYFKTLISQNTKPEQIFGPVDVPALAQGIQRVKIQGYAATCQMLYLDEVFKANGLVLNQLLWLLNEREYRNGDEGILKCPLIGIYAASNEVPLDKELGPVYDRFLLRLNVNYLHSQNSTLRMFETYLGENEELQAPTLNEGSLASLKLKVKQTVIDPELRVKILRVRNQIKQATDYTPSDRRLNAGLRLMQANAVLRGRTKCNAKDLSVLADVFWHDPATATKVRAIVMNEADSASADIESYENNANSIYETALKTGDIDGALTRLDQMMLLTKKFATGQGKKIHTKIVEIKKSLTEVLDSRGVFHVTRIDEQKAFWFKVNVTTSQLWSATQLRSVGFKQKRNGGYWYQEQVTEKSLKLSVHKQLNAVLKITALF